MNIQWKQEYELGIEKIDQQHMRLVALLNRLHDANITNKGADTLDTIYIGLIDYCKYHFTIEEFTMKYKKYTGFNEHKDKHDLFVKKIGELKREYLSGKPNALNDTLAYLNLWLIEHIMVEDRKYVPFVK